MHPEGKGTSTRRMIPSAWPRKRCLAMGTSSKIGSSQQERQAGEHVGCGAVLGSALGFGELVTGFLKLLPGFFHLLFCLLLARLRSPSLPNVLLALQLLLPCLGFLLFRCRLCLSHLLRSCLHVLLGVLQLLLLCRQLILFLLHGRFFG